jgi:hypothetical protein
MTRAAYVWRNGECYCWDEGIQNWTSTMCPAPDSGCCGSSVTADPALPGTAEAVVTADKVGGGSRATVDRGAERMRRLVVSIRISPPVGATATALEVSVPRRWTVTSASDGGAWDDMHRKVKWGPLYGDQARTVTFGVEGAVGRLPAVIDRVTADVLPKGFGGTISFDGVNRPIEMP